MLIKDYENRCLARNLKRKRVLEFLRDETWSSVSILAQVMSLSVSAAYKSLASFEREGIVTSHYDESLNFRVWGITNAGLFQAWDDEPSMEKRSPFEPAKFKPLMASHELNLQLARLKAESSGWAGWMLGKHLKYADKRPDAIANDINGNTVFVEMEQTIKSRQRIEAILSIYLQKVKRQELSYVVYLCPDLVFARRLEKLFLSIKEIPVAGSRVELTDKHRSKFVITCLDSWPPMAI